MRVRALQLGYYGNERRREGEIFDLIPIVSINKETGEKVIVPVDKQFSVKWMERVEDTTETFKPVRPKPGLTDKVPGAGPKPGSLKKTEPAIVATPVNSFAEAVKKVEVKKPKKSNESLSDGGGVI